FFFSSRRRHTRSKRDWVQTCALPILLLESALEFVEEDIPTPRANEIDSDLAVVSSGVEKLARSYSAGRLLQEGVRVAITGCPNEIGRASCRDRGSRAVGGGRCRDTRW